MTHAWRHEGEKMKNNRVLVSVNMAINEGLKLFGKALNEFPGANGTLAIPSFTDEEKVFVCRARRVVTINNGWSRVVFHHWSENDDDGSSRQEDHWGSWFEPDEGVECSENSCE
jgi:hypothetical protein